MSQAEIGARAEASGTGAERSGEARCSHAVDVAKRRPQAVAWDLLVAPLIDMGLRKQRRHTAEEHDAIMRRVAAKVSYLDEGQLVALAEVVARNAGGAARNVWPDEVSICNWAAAIEPPPESDSKLVRSYMASRAGRAALEEGIEVAVALRRHLKREGRPPSSWDWKMIREAADGWRRQRGEYMRAERDGRAGDVAKRWLAEFAKVADQARTLVQGSDSDEG